jgi:CDP-diacylglycerol--glycerol-3-phosphate 3-phosphatidyltransferase
MTNTATRSAAVAHGLYALKPWYARRLSGVRGCLVARNVSPNLVSAIGVACGAVAGVALARLPYGVVAALVVGVALAARLAAANLDGGLARALGRTTRRGSIVNELADRLAELAALAGLLAVAPIGLVAVAALAMSAPSWVALAGAASGAPRLQGGPVGKTERAALLVVIALTGWAVPLLAILAVGSALTAAGRLARLLRSPR